MKRLAKLVTVAAASAAVATVGLVAPGDAAAGTVPAYTQPASGAVSITSGANAINVMVINRTDADKCTVTATRKDSKAKNGVKVLTRTVTLSALNRHTAIADFRGLLNKTTYTVSGTCEGTKVIPDPNAPKDETDGQTKTDPARNDAAETTEKVTTNLLGGTNKVAVKVDNAVIPRYGQCLEIVKGTAWDLGLRGAPMEFVMGLATQFCPR